MKFLRYVSLLIVFCGLLFSCLSHAFAVANTLPNNAFFSALNFDKKVVLSHPSYGFWIDFSNNKAVVNPLSSKELLSNVSLIFKSSNLVNSNNLLKKYNVSRVLVTDEMMSGLVWEKEDLGLVYLLKNAENFKESFSENGVFVWEVKCSISV